MTASSGLIEHNLIANNTGVGLQVGAATVRYNTFTGNKGNTIVVQGGTPVTIEYNNLEGNTGTYDLYLNIASGVFVLAQHNWWGTTDNLLIAERIYDWNDDDTKATASYTLKATAPDQTAPGYVRSITVLPDTTRVSKLAPSKPSSASPWTSNNSPSMLFYDNIKGTWSQYNTSNSGLPNNFVRGVAMEASGTKWFSAHLVGVSPALTEPIGRSITHLILDCQCNDYPWQLHLKLMAQNGLLRVVMVSLVLTEAPGRSITLPIRGCQHLHSWLLQLKPTAQNGSAPCGAVSPVLTERRGRFTTPLIQGCQAILSVAICNSGRRHKMVCGRSDGVSSVYMELPG